MSSSSQNQFFVYFQRGVATLETAREGLALHDLETAGVQPEAFTVRYEHLSFKVTLEDSEQVASDARAIAGAEERWRPLALCTARFSVEVSDLNAALEEINTMMELQGALQDCADGYLVLPWNGGILGPWGGV